MTEKTLTTENIKPLIDELRGELAPWPVVAMKQDKLNGTQKSAVNSGITSGLVAQIIANTAAIRALESAITGTGLRALVVASLPAVGTQGILYIVPVTTYDPATDADVVNYSNEYIWIVAPDAPVTQGYYEQVGQTGIVINNGQLTITVNGTSVGTFTANQAGDTTAAITVPTNADYVDRTTAQTAAGVKTFSDGIVGNVTGNVTGDLTGTASRAIADADGNTISSTYGKLAGSQTWTGNNTYRADSIIGTNSGSATNYGNFRLTADGTSAGYGVFQRTDSSNWYLMITDLNDALGRWKYIPVSMTLSDGYVTVNGRLRTTLNYTIGTAPTSDVNFVPVNSRDSLGQNVFAMTSTVYTDETADWYQYVIRNNNTQGFRFFVSADGTSDVSLTPITNGITKLGTSTKRWSSVYADSYYYGTTAWGLDKANVWSTQQKFTGNNTRGVLSIYNPAHTKGSATSTSELSIGTIFFGDSGNTGLANSLGFVSCDLSASGNKTTLALSAIKNEASSTERANLVLLYDKSDNTNPEKMLCKGTVLPNSDATYNLGTSTNKWKTLNGVNPGALSLPDYANYVDITSSMSSATLDGTTSIDINDYLPNMTGWLNVVIADATGDYIFATQGKSGTASGFNTSRSFHAGASAGGYIVLFMPIVADSWHSLFVKASSLTQVRFYPCLGNV